MGDTNIEIRVFLNVGSNEISNIPGCMGTESPNGETLPLAGVRSVAKSLETQFCNDPEPLVHDIKRSRNKYYAPAFRDIFVLLLFNYKLHPAVLLALGDCRIVV